MPARDKAGWEAAFSRWAVGPATTEATKCDNAERMVREAIRDYTPLAGRNIKVFAQGSYRNRTNVRGDSDVDVCVLCTDTFFGNYEFLPPGTTFATLGFSEAYYQFPDLKRDIEAALVARFGDDVTPGSKAFDIHGNSYRPSADVVPAFEGRLYYPNAYGPPTYRSGIVLRCNSSDRIIYNWPQQHYDNGVSRHTATKKQFKKKARILKNLSNEMAADGFESAMKMPSFLLESLVYNCDDFTLTQSTHFDAMKYVLLMNWDDTRTDEKAKKLLEVNGIKFLFHETQSWEREDVNQFLFDALVHVGYV